MFRSLIPAALIALLAQPASALQTFCVSNMAQFNSAWQTDDDIEIRLVTGTYNVAGSCLDSTSACALEMNHSARVRGGYNAGCGSRVLDPAATEFIATGRFLLMTAEDSLSIDRLRFRTADRAAIASQEGSIQIDQVGFDTLGDLLIEGEEDLILRSSLFTRNSIANQSNSLDLFSINGNFLVENNTFARNLNGPLFYRAGGIIRNNIFWDNGSADVIFDADEDPLQYSVRNNIWGTATGVGNLANPPVGTLTSNPQFVNAAALDFRLQAISPAISTAFPSQSLLVQSDFDGGVRWFGEAPDRGAFESSVGTTAPLIIVQNANDSGVGSLRQAILDANGSANVNRIEFDIGTTCGPQNIVLSSPLPTVTNPVVIDGYTQPGAQRNSQEVGSNAVRCIAITGGGSQLNAISTGSSDSSSVTIDGLGFGGFSLIAVNLTGGNGHRLVGSQIGGQMGSLTLAPSVNGVQVGSLLGSSAADGVEIGGDTPAERNVFSDVTDAAIRLGGGAEDARVVNNYIGIGPTGALATDSNRDGVVINGRNNLISGNVISNNTRHGVLLTGSNARGNRVTENRIGIEALCVFSCGSTLGNTEDGVRIEAGANDNVIERNVIRYNGDDGVVVDNAVRNAILRNEITDNTEQPIDLGDDGVSSNGNNTQPPAGSANFGQNRPVLSDANGGISAGTARGTLNSANGNYRIDFYSATNCPTPPFLPPVPSGEPQTWLGSSFVTISNGSATADGSTSFSGLIGVVGNLTFFNTTRRIAATATRMAGSSNQSQPRSTSEVSSCVTYDVQFFRNGFEN